MCRVDQATRDSMNPVFSNLEYFFQNAYVEGVQRNEMGGILLYSQMILLQAFLSSQKGADLAWGPGLRVYLEVRSNSKSN